MTPEEAARQYAEITDILISSAKDAEIGALFGLRASMTKRIHNQGQNSNGGKIGNYKNTWYKKKRKEKGLQTGYVDLTFNRDLFRSYRVGVVKETGNNALGFLNDLQRKKGEKQEDNYGVIFHPSNADNRKLADDFGRLLNNLLRKRYNSKGYAVE